MSDDPITPNEQLTDGTENFYSGSEPFFSFFTQAQVLLSTVRFTIDAKIVANSADLASQMEAARRSFQHSGDLIMAVQDALRITALFGKRVQLWERELQSFERTKHASSGALIQRIKAEAAHIRVKVHAIQRALVKLEVTLQQMAGEAKTDA